MNCLVVGDYDFSSVSLQRRVVNTTNIVTLQYAVYIVTANYSSAGAISELDGLWSR